MRRDEHEIPGRYTCAVNGCTQDTTWVREGKAGYPIGYCSEHGKQAERLFDERQLKAVA